MTKNEYYLRKKVKNITLHFRIQYMCLEYGGDTVVLLAGHQTCDSQVAGSR